MLGKDWYKSRTLWFGLLYFIVNIAGLFGWQAYQPDAQTAEIVGVLVSIAVILLRLVTRQPIGAARK